MLLFIIEALALLLIQERALVLLVGFANPQFFSANHELGNLRRRLAKSYAKVITIVIVGVRLAGDKELKRTTDLGLRGLDSDVTVKGAANALANAQSETQAFTLSLFAVLMHPLFVVGVENVLLVVLFYSAALVSDLDGDSALALRLHLNGPTHSDR